MQGAPIVTIFGGSGFVGRYIAQRMARAGWRVRVAVRRPNDALFVKPYGTVGQVEPVQANVRDEASTSAAIEGADAVVNCAAILGELGKQRFDSVIVEGAARVARLSVHHGVKSLVHISALGANSESESEYVRAKATAEASVLNEFPGATILRPSIVFGNEDKFFNRFAKMATLSPIIPSIGANTRFQPVFVGDVAKAAEVAILKGRGGIFELAGPDAETFRELMQRMLKVIRRKKVIVAVPFFVGKIMGSVFGLIQFLSGGLIPNTVITRDQVASLQYDNVATGEVSGLRDLGIEPTSMDVVLDSYLYSYRPQGQYTALTEAAGDMRDA